VGKSAFAGQLAVNAANAGFGAAYASLEMSREEVTIRALSAHKHLPVEDIEATLAKADLPEILALQQELPLFGVDDSGRPDWNTLKAYVTQQSEAFGQPVRLLVVDHLRLMARYGGGRGEMERVQRLAEDAKTFAKEADVVLVVLHQVGRSVEGSQGRKNHGDTRLTMEDGMFGAEADADVVLGVYRPERNPDLTEPQRQAVNGVMVCQLLKNRHGNSCIPGIVLNWKRPSMYIEQSGMEVDYLTDILKDKK
jgi:replicative DNA helicase